MLNSEIKIYIDPLWINGKTCLTQIKNNYDYLRAQNSITKMRKKFVEKLQEEGFLVILEKSLIDQDTICLIMDDTALCSEDVPIAIYKRKFDEKIMASGGPNLNYPLSKSVKDYFMEPFLPAVFKNELENGGVDKFLIENEEQIKVMKSFYEEYSNDPKIKEAFDCSIFQQYLETPSRYATYLRVLVGGTGKCLGASLKYSKKIDFKRPFTGLFETIFLNSASNYFLNSKRMFNYYSGGENIYFSQPRYSSEKTSILESHGFNVGHLTLPNTVVDVCQNIMENCNRELGVLCGFDFMLNELDGKWYYLENQAFPAIDEWAHEKEINLPTSHTMNGYLKILELELQVRYESLMLLVEKRKEESKNLIKR